MFEPSEYATRAALLRGIARLIYGSAAQREAIKIADVHEAFPEAKADAVDSALKKMDALELILIELEGPMIRGLGYGKACFERDCIPETVFGVDYIAKKYRNAIVHIIVGEPNGEESGGTGYFWADFPNHLITAAHVLDGRTVKRIEDSSGNVLELTRGPIRVGPGDLDLATLECDMPSGTEPIRVEWNPDSAAPGAGLIVFGYPRIAFHLPSLYQSRAELHSIARRYPSSRESLIISSTTHPGCSGGPVMDLRGFAIGVIEQENVLEQRAGTSAYFSATPAHYLRELVPQPQ
ncbi:MAG TPA: serine protease [Candidatus Dormibacteraeota bacterium]|jgi:hypothetical protein|nr:serine protease [Candidatus Dormibacteraeota bacterium]